MLPDLRIHWEGFWPIGHGCALPSARALDASMGVYQIVTKPFGSEPVYIGKAYRQSFRQRVPQHGREVLAAWLDRNIDASLFLRVDTWNCSRNRGSPRNFWTTSRASSCSRTSHGPT